jgi:hypothetical protein
MWLILSRNMNNDFARNNQKTLSKRPFPTDQYNQRVESSFRTSQIAVEFPGSLIAWREIIKESS